MLYPYVWIGARVPSGHVSVQARAPALRAGRLPTRAIAELDAAGLDADVKYIANLSTMSSGLLCRFATTAAAFTVRVQRDFARIPGSAEQDDIMSFNGRFGVDLYCATPSMQVVLLP